MKKRAFLLLFLILGVMLLVCACVGGGDTQTNTDTETEDTSTDSGNTVCKQHKLAIQEAVPATCTETGLTEGRYCANCGQVFNSQVVIPKLGHKEITVEYKAPTCNSEGHNAGTRCERCGEAFDGGETLARLEHVEASGKATEPTCTSEGSTARVYCTVCGKTLVASEKIPMLSHIEVENEYKAPSCSSVGLEGGSHCSVCNTVIVKPTEIPTLPHTEVENKYKAPTCDEPGYIGGTCCSVCNATIVKGEEIEPLGHKEIELAGYAPTCSKTGLTDGKHCTVCDKDTVPQYVIDKASHNEIVTRAIPATCQSVGYTEKRQCSVCKQITVASEVIPMTGHTEVIDKAAAPNCSETGLTEGKHCAVCNTVIVAQQTVGKTSDHVFEEFATVTKSPTTSQSGSGTHKCIKCGKSVSVTFPKLSVSKLTKDNIYSIETDIYNQAYVNRWKLFDGSTKTAGLWSPGDEWFGNVGDVLTITLDQEMVISKFVIYRTGNYTYAKYTIKDSAGNVTFQTTDRVDGGDVYGGYSQAKTLFSGKSYKAYTIEIEITSNKGPMTYKIAELEITAAAYDTRIPHTHDYREFVEVGKAATCQANGADVYECFCGARKEISTPKIDHAYSYVAEEKVVSCTVGGRVVYECECGAQKTETSEPTGHSFNKLVEYKVVPTVANSGKATYKCLYCSLREDRSLSILPLEDINYLRVDSLSDGKIVLKLNMYEELPSFEVRYSTKEITAQNFENATLVTPKISGEALVTLILDLQADLNSGIYVAVRPYVGTNYGEIATIRVGGNGEIPIDYDSARVYHGEVLNSFKALFDNDTSTKLGQIFTDKNDTQLYGSYLRPIVDLEYMHYVSRVKLYYDAAGKTVTVRWSDTAVDFMAEDKAWDGVKTFTTTAGWNEIEIDSTIRYFQIVFTDGEAPSEVEAYGFQCGEGDVISTTKRDKATIGELIGMCGFVASGGGNTPIDSVICTNVLREYHNFGWSYVASNYGGKASVFKGESNYMGNFESQYAAYKAAGINVIPCIQWKLGSGETISYKVDENGLPIRQNGELVKATFWERFDPNTYFVFADNVFMFSARFGRNTTKELLAIAKMHCGDSNVQVGLNTIEWIELGNEPEGGWNGIHNYLSAYMLAAATSAAYDGHCSTIPTPSEGGYHLGGKNADSTMKLAMAGVSGVSNEYITALIYWMKANRNDSYAAFDAFNVHHYMSKEIELPNGSTAYVGISPEEAKMDEVLSQLVELRDKYYPEKEVWITEFGWDTNQSYSTATSSHAYGEYTGRQVQAMWLTRAYLIFAAVGLDKADMYMCEDAGVEAESTGKYGTCGVIAFERDENGNTYEVKKDSYYYLYTLKNTLGAYTFDSEIEAYDENVMIYRFVTDEGKEAYAVWCKTSDGTKHEGYELRINGETATVVEAVYGDIDGVKTKITADEFNCVSVNVSENPIYVVVD